MADKGAGNYNAAFGSQRKFKWKVGTSGSYSAAVPPILPRAGSVPEHLGMIRPRTLNIEDTNIANLGTELEKKVKLSAAQTEKQWADAGKAVGVEIWRIEQFKVVDWPKADYGQFYSGDSYIVLRTYKKDPRSPKLSYDIFFWLGKNTSQDEAGTAAYKTVELDDIFGGAAVQHREVDGCESDLFMGLFTHFRTLEGGCQTGFRHVTPKEYKPRLLRCKGSKPCVVRQVNLTRDSLNSGDVFVLDMGLKVYQFNGKASTGAERGEGAELCRALDDERGGQVSIVVLEEGEAHVEWADFWAPLGGRGPIPAAGPADEEEKCIKSLWRLSDASGSLKFEKIAEGTKVKKVLLSSADAFIFDAGYEVFVWIGLASSTAEKRFGLKYAQEYLKEHNRDLELPISRILQGGENETFLAAFD